MAVSQPAQARLEAPVTTKRWMWYGASSRSASVMAREAAATIGTCSGIEARCCGAFMNSDQLCATLSSSARLPPSSA